MGTVCVRPMENSLLGDSMSSETARRDGSSIFLLLKKKKHLWWVCIFLFSLLQSIYGVRIFPLLKMGSHSSNYRMKSSCFSGLLGL